MIWNVFWPIMQQQISFSMQIFKTTSRIFPVQLVVEESCSSLSSDKQHPAYPSNCSSFLYFSSPDETLPFALCSGVLAVANLHLPCSFHLSFCCKSGNNFLWAVFLKSLSFALATAMRGNVMNRYRSAHWCVVASGSWLFCSISLLYSVAIFFFLNNVFCFLRDCCEYKKQSPTFSSDQSLCSSYAKYLGMYVSMEQGTLLSSSHCHQSQVSIYL